jgi:hypothetical protein
MRIYARNFQYAIFSFLVLHLCNVQEEIALFHFLNHFKKLKK